jgi:hypothetical protein
MSFKKAIISTVAAAAIATTVSAAEVSLNQKGNYIVMPAYYAISNGNWKTDLRVVNTNTTDAIVAKVVVRSYENSQELLDFPIYLSPGDVWVASLEDAGSGDVHLKCTDDSMIIGGKVVNDTNNTVNQPLFDNCSANGCKQHGYVEVFVVAQEPASDIARRQRVTWNEGTPLGKLAMYNDFMAPGKGHATNWGFPDDKSVYAQTNVSADGAGQEKAMTLMATAVADLVHLSAVDVDLIGTDSTFSGVYGPGAMAYPSELGAALEKTNVYVTFYNDTANETQLLLTQPAKHYLDGNYSNGSPLADQYDNDGVTWFQHIGRNNTENTLQMPTPVPPDFSGGKPVDVNLTTTPCKYELCDIMVSNHMDGFGQGYVDFKLYGEDQNNTNSAVHSLSAIPSVITGVKVGNVAALNMYKPAYQEK